MFLERVVDALPIAHVLHRLLVRLRDGRQHLDDLLEQRGRDHNDARGAIGEDNIALGSNYYLRACPGGGGGVCGRTAATLVPSMLTGSSTATILLSAAAPTVLSPLENTCAASVSACVCLCVSASKQASKQTHHEILVDAHLRHVAHAPVNDDHARAQLVHALGDDAADDRAALSARLRHDDAAVRGDEVGEVRSGRERARRVRAVQRREEHRCRERDGDAAAAARD